jgi:hypothetical protein
MGKDFSTNKTFFATIIHYRRKRDYGRLDGHVSRCKGGG